MKLNKEQRIAVARDLSKSINKSIDIYNRKLQDKKDLLEEPIKDKLRERYLNLQSLCKSLIKDGVHNYYLKEFAKSSNTISFCLPSKTKLKEIVNYNDIENDLILASIECEDLSKIKESILKKYSK